jgi:hypothetical protein
MSGAASSPLCRPYRFVDLPHDLLRTLSELLVELEHHDLGDEHLERSLVERTIEDAAQPWLRAGDVTVGGVRIEDDEHTLISRGSQRARSPRPGVESHKRIARQRSAEGTGDQGDPRTNGGRAGLSAHSADPATRPSALSARRRRP